MNLQQPTSPGRYYIINIKKAKRQSRVIQAREEVLIDRPTAWRTFLCGFFSGFMCFHGNLAFVHLPTHVAELYLYHGTLGYYHHEEGEFKINGFTYHVEAWNIWNVIKFCIESFQYRSFWELKKWRWK